MIQHRREVATDEQTVIGHAVPVRLQIPVDLVHDEVRVCRQILEAELVERRMDDRLRFLVDRDRTLDDAFVLQRCDGRGAGTECFAEAQAAMAARNGVAVHGGALAPGAAWSSLLERTI